MDPIIAVIVSFIIFSGVAYRFGYRQSMKALDAKIAYIRHTLESATKAKEAAIQALNEERRRYGAVMKEVDLTLKRAEEETLSFRHQTLKDLDHLVKKRHQEAEEIIHRLREGAFQSIQEEVTAATLATFEALVETTFSPTQHEILNEKSIASIAAQLAEQPTPLAKKTKPKSATIKR